MYRAFVVGVECAMEHILLRLLPDPENATVDKKVAPLINHAYLVDYFACFCIRESCVTVMEFIPGVDVIAQLRKCMKPPEVAVEIFVAQFDSVP